MHNIKSKEMVSTINKSKFSKKFYFGIALIISGLIVGKVTQTTFVIYFNNEFIRKLAVIIYIASWLPFIIGITWAGREYAKKYNRFFTLKYYKDKFKSIRK
jgi:hypothetical protein